jgi:flavin-dependent dehydrogenase
MYDAIVVGARCAGSPTAMLLARKGYRVLLLDRAGFPSDTLSVHYIHQAGTSRLSRWGLLEQVAGTNCPPVYEQTLDVGPFALRGTPPPIDGVGAGYCPRRTVLDQILVDAAVAAGAELREHFTVKDLLFDGDRVIGVRGHARRGTPVVERAKIVIGADGLHSLVARAAGAAVYNDRPSFACAYYSYWAGVPIGGAEIYPRTDRAIITAPTNDGQAVVIAYWPASMFHEVRADIEGNFMRSLELTPSLTERVRGGTRTERFRGTVDLPNFYRKPFGPGWALVGDAGYHKDPISAQGISDAFRDAELLAEAIADGFAGRRPLADALASYEAQRNEATAAIYEMTVQMAMLQPPTVEQQLLFAALRDNQDASNRFIGTLAGSVRLETFFAPDSIGRIIGAAEPIQAA